jgi:hypothetical protein
MNHLKIPLVLPFKFIPDTNGEPGVHFDDNWASTQIRSHEMQVRYLQKWNKADTTKLQIESSLPPANLKVMGVDGLTKKELAWTAVVIGVSYKIYELVFDISDLPEGIYFLYLRVAFLSIEWAAISEPIHMKDKWKRTMLFKYKNSYNDWDTAFTTGAEFAFRCEADIPPAKMEPQRVRNTSISQTRNVKTLSATPYRVYKLEIAEPRGVAPWVMDLLNRIFACDHVTIEGKRYETDADAKWEHKNIEGYPLVGGSIDLVDGRNLSSLNFADTSELAPGIIVAYNIETAFFGPGTLVPITEVQTS